MAGKKTKPSWIVKQKSDIDERINALFNPKEFKYDPKGYYLIRIDYKKKIIELALCTYKHVIKKVIIGKDAMSITYTLHRHHLVSDPNHSAYLGRELAKAEMALKYGLEYIQEAPLDFSKKIKKTKKK